MSTIKQPAASQGRPGVMRRVRPYLTDLAAFATALCTAALAALLLGSLHGCGGGVGGEGTGSFASATFASGPITGFGSIVVNGVRFDDSSATVLDDDGAPADRSVLALGAVVQVTGSAITQAADGTSVATAMQIQISRSVVGQVSSLDRAGSRLVVLGQTVRTTTNTVFDSRLSGGLSALAVGQLVEVYGAYDASTSSYQATRIALASSSTGLLVRGPVSASNSSSQTFRIGGQSFSYASLGQGSSPEDGAVVQVKVKSSTDDQGRWVVSSSPKSSAKPSSGEATELHGLVSAVLSATRFVVDGLTVDTADIAGGVTLQPGAQVEVSGKVQGGVLVASKVSIEDAQAERDFELRGSITSLDTANKRLMVRGATVSYARSDLRFKDGSVADLALGRSVKIEGRLASDGTLLEAVEIEFD